MKSENNNNKHIVLILGYDLRQNDFAFHDLRQIKMALLFIFSVVTSGSVIA